MTTQPGSLILFDYSETLRYNFLRQTKLTSRLKRRFIIKASNILIYNAVVYTPEAVLPQGWLLTEGEKIVQIGSGEPPAIETAFHIDAAGKTLLPGFIDVHIHGSIGVDSMDADPAGLLKIAQYLPSHGVTGFLPTTWAASHADILAAIQAIKTAMQTGPQTGAEILGAHMEGPYLNPQRCGAQDLSQIRRANLKELSECLDSGIVRLIALAPEFEENQAAIQECVRRGVTVSAGHTAATYEQMKQAVALGVSHTTHTFNAMTPLSHRNVGTVGAALALDELYCEAICDTIHVEPPALKILARAKGPDKVIIVTDCIRGTGLPDGEYKADHRTMIIKDGAARLPNGTLMGSTSSIDNGLKNMVAASGFELSQAWKMSSLNAAKSIHVDDRKGSLTAGKDADLVLIDREFKVHCTIARGQVAYQA